MPSVLLTNYYSQPLLSIIRTVVPAGFNIIALDEPTREEILRKAPKADYFLVGGRLKIDREVVAKATRLKMVQRTGVGLDSLDLQALKVRGIPTYVNPGINARSVAEHTLLLILAVMKRLTFIDATLKSGKWAKHELGIQNHDLFGKTVGLIGLGNIGKQVSQMLLPFGVTVIYHKRKRLPSEEEKSLNVTFREFHDLLAESDIISLHCPLTSDTDRLIGREELAKMKGGAILINTSRGRLIDEHAMIHFLNQGTLKGVGLDVFEQEPIRPNNELLKRNNVVLTPHISGITYESFNNMMFNAFKNILHFEIGDLISIEDKRLIYE